MPDLPCWRAQHNHGSGCGIRGSHCAPDFVGRALRSRQWTSRRRVLHCTRGADLGPLVAPAPSQQTNELFYTGFTFLRPYGGGLYKVGARPALLAGVTHPRQWVWHSWLTLRARLCLSGVAFTSVDVALPRAALHQRGRPWPAGCTSSQPTN